MNVSKSETTSTWAIYILALCLTVYLYIYSKQMIYVYLHITNSLTWSPRFYFTDRFDDSSQKFQAPIDSTKHGSPFEVCLDSIRNKTTTLWTMFFQLPSKCFGSGWSNDNRNESFTKSINSFWFPRFNPFEKY